MPVDLICLYHHNLNNYIVLMLTVCGVLVIATCKNCELNTVSYFSRENASSKI